MEAEVVIPPQEFHTSTLIALGGLPAQLHLNLIICKVELPRFFLWIRGVRDDICRFCVSCTQSARGFSEMRVHLLPIVYFLPGRLRQGATYRRAHGGSRRQICRSWATNLSSTCWGDKGSLIPAHEHRVEIIRQTPDNRSITNIIASGSLDTIVRRGTFCWRAGRFAAGEEAILRCYSKS